MLFASAPVLVKLVLAVIYVYDRLAVTFRVNTYLAGADIKA